jgi:BirA family biotin operon repressor/biotin-[acetyl-CoA-carboxylase] ligase
MPPQNRILGRRILRVQETASTQDLLRDLVRNGSAEEGTLIVADRQTSGRGRLGRRWAEIPGRQIFASILLIPDVPLEKWPMLSLLAGVAVAEALEAYGLRGVGLKWPNDVWAGGGKICGILPEVTVGRDRAAVVLGIGLNVEGSKAEIPSEIRATATTVQIERPSPHPDPMAILNLILEKLEARYERFRKEGSAQILEAFRERWIHAGKIVQVDTGVEKVRGTAVSIDSDGALLLETDGKIVRRIPAGDVTPVS